MICVLFIALFWLMGRYHDDVIKWKHFPRYWPFVRGIHRSPVKSPNKGQWRGALMFSLMCTGINCWVNNGEAGDLRRHHYDVTVMMKLWPSGLEDLSLGIHIGINLAFWFKLDVVILYLYIRNHTVIGLQGTYMITKSPVILSHYIMSRLS